MKSKPIVLVTMALFAAGSAQALNSMDGNVSDDIFVLGDDPYSRSYEFLLDDTTSLTVAAIAKFSDTPGNNPSYFLIYSYRDNFNIEGSYFSDELVTFQFNDIPPGHYNYLVYGQNYGSQTEQITFSATTVPEPESYAMLLAGLGVLGFVEQRRKLLKIVEINTQAT